MNENKKLSLIAIAIILAGLIYTEFTVFLNWGPMVNAAIEADESIDPGSMIFLVTSTISLIVLGISGIIISFEVIRNNDKLQFIKISSILVIFAILLFLIQIVGGFLAMMGIL